jgi:hypothetical protein
MNAAMRKKEQPAKRPPRAEGDPVVQRIAEFLNTDLNSSDDKKWGLYQTALSYENIDHSGKIVLAHDEWQRAKKVAALLELLDEQDLCRVGLVSELDGLQQRLSSELAPLTRAKSIQSVQAQLMEIIRTLNALEFRAQWALYSLEPDQGKEQPTWHCYYHPEQGSSGRDASVSEVYAQKFFTIKIESSGQEQQMCAKTLFACQSSIVHRLYAWVASAIMNATIQTLKRCVHCGRYFAAQNSKQIACSADCRTARNT